MARDPRLPPPIPAADAANPYAAPSAHVADVSPGASEAEQIRAAHIRHERQIKSIGALYFLGGVIWLFAAISLLAVGSTSAPFGTGALAVYAVLAIAAFVVGYGFRRLRPWVRIPGGILSGLGLLAIPVGTLVNAWALWAMFCAKGQVILSPSYDAIVAATPHVKYRWTLGDKIATAILALIILAFVAAIVVPQFLR